MSKVINATVANLTFLVGQLEEIKSNVNDTLRYVKQNSDKWDTKEEEALKNESTKDDDATQE
jgi:hypothetical protein